MFSLLFIPNIIVVTMCANEKSKERGEPGKIYHMRNVMGRENLITCGRTNELAHVFSCFIDRIML